MLIKEFKLKSLFAILAIFVIGGCTYTTNIDSFNQPKLNDYSLGEKWTWEFKGVTEQGVIRADGIDSREVVEEDGALTIRSSKSSVPVADIVQPDLSETPRYHWPLEVGKTWVYESHWTSEDGTTGKTVQDVEVIYYQKETVKAGTFMAYTIVFDGKVTNSRGYNAATKEVIVYAPNVKNFIKLTQIQDGYRYVEELAEYVKP